MEKKLAQKVKRLLGSEYFLCDKLDMENMKEGWVLYRLDYKETVMTSETNTDEELLAYAKAHHKWDLAQAILRVGLTICIATLILLILNTLIFKNNILKGSLLAAQLVVLIFNMTVSRVDSHNFKVFRLDFDEEMKRMEEEMKRTKEETKLENNEERDI